MKGAIPPLATITEELPLQLSIQLTTLLLAVVINSSGLFKIIVSFSTHPYISSVAKI